VLAGLLDPAGTSGRWWCRRCRGWRGRQDDAGRGGRACSRGTRMARRRGPVHRLARLWRGAGGAGAGTGCSAADAGRSVEHIPPGVEERAALYRSVLAQATEPGALEALPSGYQLLGRAVQLACGSNAQHAHATRSVVCARRGNTRPFSVAVCATATALRGLARNPRPEARVYRQSCLRSACYPAVSLFMSNRLKSVHMKSRHVPPLPAPSGAAGMLFGRPQPVGLPFLNDQANRLNDVIEHPGGGFDHLYRSGTGHPGVWAHPQLLMFFTIYRYTRICLKRRKAGGKYILPQTTRVSYVEVWPLGREPRSAHFRRGNEKKSAFS
jgi:hypothetical protein